MDLNQTVIGKLYLAFTAFDPLPPHATEVDIEESIIKKQTSELEDFISNNEDLTYQDLVDSNIAPDATFFNDFNSQEIPQGCHVEVLTVTFLAWVGFPKGTQPAQVESELEAIKLWCFQNYGITFFCDPFTKLAEEEAFKHYKVLKAQPTCEDAELEFHMIDLY